MTPRPCALFISAPLLLAVFCLLVRRHRLLLVCFALSPPFELNGANTCPLFERSPSLMVHFVWCLFHVERCQWEPSSAAASLGRVTTARDCVRFAFCRGWKTTTPDDDFGSLCFLDIQRKGTNMVHEISCPGVSCAGNDACPEGSLCANITRLIMSEKDLSLS